jgi:hypothetical protein
LLGADPAYGDGVARALKLNVLKADYAQASVNTQNRPAVIT